MTLEVSDRDKLFVSYDFMKVDIFQPPDTAGFEDSLRARAAELARNFEAEYVEMMYIFYKVAEDFKPENGKKTCLYREWGYESLGAYAESELKIGRRKAERLRLIWAMIFVHLKISDEQRSRFLDLGVSKLRELVRVLSNENAQGWLDIAEHSSYAVLAQKVGKALDEKKKSELAARVEAGQDASFAEGADFGESVLTTAPSNENAGSIREDAFSEDKVATERFESNKSGDAPQMQETNFMSFALYPEQELNVLRALECAEKLNGSSKKGHLLDLVCTDFIATNELPTSKNKTEVIGMYLSKLESLLGIRIIAIDPKTKIPMYGMKTLEKLAALAAAAE